MLSGFIFSLLVSQFNKIKILKNEYGYVGVRACISTKALFLLDMCHINVFFYNFNTYLLHMQSIKLSTTTK